MARGERKVAVDGNISNSIIVTGDGNVINVAVLPVFKPLHQLPSPPHDFTGRAKELDELVAALDSGAIISGMQGLGGVGKTALALKLAEQIRDRYPDAQFFLDLRGVSDKPVTPAEAMAHVIRAYQPTVHLPESEAELLPLYRSVLHDQRALLIMDNACDDAQVRPLIPPATCLMLITSRRHFTLPKMKSLRLGALSPEDAVKLLHEIAPRIEDWDGYDAEIAAACVHLPLALRAAGSLLEATLDLYPADYARQLQDERMRIETIGSEGVDFGVEASFNLSYNRLTPEASRVFRQLAIFAGSFDPAAEEAVCQDTEHKMLSELARLCLVEYDDKGQRYGLHDLMRLFANMRMSEDEREAAKYRHAKHFCSTLKQANALYEQGGEAVARGLTLYDLELANIEAGQAWVDTHAGEVDSAAELCIEYSDAGVEMLLLRQHAREYIRWQESALSAARKMNRSISESNSLGNIGIGYANLGDTYKAIEFFDQQLVIARETGDLRSKCRALVNLGVGYKNLNKAHEAIEMLKQAQVIAHEIGYRRGEGRAIGNLGNVYFTLGEQSKAIEFYEQALIIRREIGDSRGESIDLTNIGNARAGLGELRSAIEAYEKALAIDRRLNDSKSEGIDLFNLGTALYKLGDRTKAIANAEAALKIFEKIESPHANEVRAQLAEWLQ
jgi:tetratricopeptide (TPR) repeat protein